VIILLLGHFHGSNFGHAGGGFFIHKSPIKAILLTLPAGIVFSLLGFEQAVQLAGEAENPQRDLARAVLGSVVIGAILYILIQIAFLGAVSPSLLASQHGWTGLSALSKSPAVVTLNKGPFYTVVSAAGIAWLATVLRIDAVISPSGTGLVYTTSASRLSFGLSRNGFIPSAFEKVDGRKVPVISVIFAVLLGILFLLPFPSWSELVNVVTSASVLMYAAAPLAFAALRRQKPDLPRPYRVSAGEILAPLAFIGSCFIIIFAGWEIYTTLMVAMLIGYALIATSYAFNANPRQAKMDWNSLPWIAAFFLGMLVISYFGAFGPGGIIGGIGFFKHVLDHGGNDDLGLGGTLGAVAAWALVIYFWALATRLPVAVVDRYIEEVYPSEMAGE
jgi:amino acid transporter